MAEKVVRFKHDYDKLEKNIFPTIRSIHYLEGMVGRIFTVESKTKKFEAVYIGHDIKMIKEIPLSFLKYDAAPLPIESHQDFVDLLNSFVPKYNPNRLSTKKKILFFEKLDPDHILMKILKEIRDENEKKY